MRALRFAVVAIGVGAIMAIGTIFATVQLAPPAETLQSSQPSSDKYDGDCTGKETVGRCADKPAFDHSLCQYPDRTTNPVNGCDNSDPCDPAQTKGGSGDCLPVVDEPIIEMEGK